MKRNTELCSKIEGVLQSGNLSSDDTKAIKELLEEYKWATYENHEDRHEFYQKKLSRMVNDFGFKEDAAAKFMASEHPTIQQGFMRFVTKFITEMGKKTYFDGRNEASVKLAKQLTPIIEESGKLPCI